MPSVANCFLLRIVLKLMKTKIDKVRAIFEEAFRDDPSWNKWFFDHVYDDEDAMLLTRGGNVVSTLMLQRYKFRYCDTDVPMAYIFGAATAEAYRGKGYMTELMTEALRESYDRGDFFVSLVPAHHNLYYYYDKFGFATTVYFDAMRYTAIHTFEADSSMRAVEPAYEMLEELEKATANTVQHSPLQFVQIMQDVKHDGGRVVAVRGIEDKSRCAMAFMTPSDGGSEYVVRALPATDEAAARTALAVALNGLAPRPVVVWSHPHRDDVALSARAMMRIVNLEAVLTALAASSPRTDQVIRVHDNFIMANNGVYLLHDGCCEHVDATMRRLTLDVSVSTLTSIIFSSPRLGQIFGLPSARASLPLMLD